MMGQRATFLCTLVSYRNNGEYSLFEFAPNPPQEVEK